MTAKHLSVILGCVLLTIPAGIPHWFKEVPKEINYYVVKVIKQ